MHNLHFGECAPTSLQEGNKAMRTPNRFEAQKEILLSIELITDFLDLNYPPGISSAGDPGKCMTV